MINAAAAIVKRLIAISSIQKKRSKTNTKLIEEI